MCARDVDVDLLFVAVVITSLPAPGIPESVRAATDTSAPAVSVVKKLFVSYLSSVLVKFRQEPMGQGLASCGQGVDDAADDLPT